MPAIQPDQTVTSIEFSSKVFIILDGIFMGFTAKVKTGFLLGK
ncbi:hypothetical protein THIOSC13_160063 [uncultured Thiomicrorhabdus sp.]|jgi:hypothetical protein